MNKWVVGLAAAWLCLPLCPQAQEPSGQPAQMNSAIEINANLADPFFRSEKLLFPWWIIENPDGTLENTQGGTTDPKRVERLKQTASCWTEYQIPHEIHFCQAKRLPGGSLEIYLHDESASTYDNLKITVSHGSFACQYWTTYPAPSGKLFWITRKQRLVLDRDRYKPGQMLKGKLVFTCEEKSAANQAPETRTITITGVFKTQVE